MVSVDDASGGQAELDRQWDYLKAADMPAKDRDAIERFIRHRKVHGTEKTGTYAKSSQKSDLHKLRLSSVRADTPLLDMGIDDVNDLIELLTTPKGEGGYGITTGIDSYTRALRVFFRWLDRHDDEGEYPFWQQIKTGNVDFPKPSERTFPDRDDYEAMMREARGDPRSQAILAFYWESAVRRSLGAQLRLKDVNLGGDGRATFQPNPNGERQKGVEIKDYPLYDGIATLRVWIKNHHPDPDNPEAPLFTVKQGYDPENAQDCALSSQRIYDILKDLGRKADIDAETKPHSFRHAAVGRWKARGYSLAQVQRRVAWSDKAAANMWGRYGDPDDEDIDRRIDDLEGQEVELEDEEEEDTGPPEKYTCGNCGLSGIVQDHCGSCGAAVSPEARQREIEEQRIREQAEESIPKAKTDFERRVVAEALATVRKQEGEPRE